VTSEEPGAAGSTSARPRSWRDRILQFGLTRIVLGVVTIVGVGIVTNLIVLGLYGALGFDAPGLDSLHYVIPLVIAVHFAYVGFVRLVERRRAEELSGKGAVRETGAGIAVGAGVLAATIGIIAALGYYQVTGSNPWTAVVPTFATAVVSGYVEEVVFRGVLFRIIEESLGTWIALAFTALLFGFVHILNPNATLFSSFAIAMEAGVLLGAAYVGTFEMGLTFVCWLVALRLATHTAQVGYLIFISPFLSLVFINLLVGETIRLNTLAGLGLIIAGLLVQHTARLRRLT